MASDLSRIRKELAECAKDTKSGVQCFPIDGNLTHLEGTIKVKVMSSCDLVSSL